MKKTILTALSLMALTVSYAQKPQWACNLISSSEAKGQDYGPEALLYIPDAYPSGMKENSYTYVLGKNYEEKTPKKIPTIKFKLEYCTPIIAEQVLIVETSRPGTITKVEIEDINGKSKVIYKGKAAAVTEEQRLFVLPFTRSSAPIRYVSIEAEPEAIAGYNTIDAVALCPTKDPVEMKINLGADLHFIAAAKPLSPKINSGYNDILPIISPNGKFLYIDRKDHPQNIRNAQHPNDHYDDIYVSKKDGKGEWMEASNVGTPMNNGSHNFVNSIAPDGNTMLLANTYNADGSPKGAGASITKRLKGSSWGVPEELKIDGFNNKNQYVSFFMSNNNKVMLMSIEDNDSYGGMDIYISQRNANGSWSKPVNIGTDINTNQEEYSPVLASDNKTMYFASQGHYGYGGYDIFVTKRLDESWTRWSKPVNLGPQINSSGNNLGFSIPASGKEVYTYRWTNDELKADIYVTQLGEAKSIKPEAVYLISGRVFDAKTKKPIHADISYETLPDGKNSGNAGSNPDDGEYHIVLPVGQHYGYYAEAKGYIAVHENLDIPANSSYTEFNKDLYLVPIQVGQKVAMNNVFFEQSKPVLLASSYPELDRMAEIMKLNPKLEIQIDGHTDNQGDAKKNTELSQQRVDVVKDYIVKRGISGKRITTKAFGGTKPIASNAKEETRKLNRRVEFTITKQ